MDTEIARRRRIRLLLQSGFLFVSEGDYAWTKKRPALLQDPHGRQVAIPLVEDTVAEINEMLELPAREDE